MSELSLRKNGVERIIYTDGVNKAVNGLAEAWEAFRTLPLEQKKKLATNNLFDGVGYESKINDSISKDRKENFDFSFSTFPRSEGLRGTNISQEAVELFEAFEKLSDESQPMLRVFWYELNSPPEYDEIRARRSARAVFIRCLHYPAGAEPGAIIAEPHTDHSGGTTHFYETTDGCEMLTFNKSEWKPMPIENAGGVRFGGMQAQYASSGEVAALCHRVIANETTAQFGRSAIVGFMPLSDMPQYNRAKMGRTQDQEPGFNYSLTPFEVEEYFRS